MHKKTIFIFIFIIHIFFTIHPLFSAEPIKLDSLTLGEYIGKHIEYLNEKELFSVLSKEWKIDSQFKERMLSGELHSSDKFQLNIELTTSGYKAVFQKNGFPEEQQSG